MSTPAPHQASEQVGVVVRAAMILTCGLGLAEKPLHPVELLAGDDRFMAVFAFGLAPFQGTDVDFIAQDAANLLLGERFPPAYLSIESFPHGNPYAKFQQLPGDGSDGAQGLEGVEELLPNNRGPFRIDDQLAFRIGLSLVTPMKPAVAQATINAIEHHNPCAFGGLFSFHLGKHQGDVKHGPANRRGCVEAFAEADEFRVVILKERPEFGKVQQAAGDSVEFEGDDMRDLSFTDVPLEPLEFRTVLILPASSSIFVKLDLAGVSSETITNIGHDHVPLGLQRIAFVCLAGRRYPKVSRNPAIVVLRRLCLLLLH